MGLCLRRLVLQYPYRGGRFRPESVAAFNRNQWQPSTGIGGRFRPESVATFARNTQAAHPDTSTDVTILLSTPHIRCTLTYSRLSISRPYFLLNQRTKRQVLKPDESTAKLFSMPLSSLPLKGIEVR